MFNDLLQGFLRTLLGWSVMIPFLIGFAFLLFFLGFESAKRKPHIKIPAGTKYYNVEEKDVSDEDDKYILFKSSEYDLSVVVPAYNEEDRITTMLDETTGFLKGTNLSYEIIVVNDGSADKTTETVLSYAEDNSIDNIRVIELGANRGKGFAVRCGVFHSAGNLILFADADGATDFQDYDKVADRLYALNNEKAVAIGSRAHLAEEDDVSIKRHKLRVLLQQGFHLFVKFVTRLPIEDTQCGFKLFTRRAAQEIFTSMHVNRWIFDVEVLILARLIGCKVEEVPVNWEEIDGSKLNVASATVEMFIDLIKLSVRYSLKFWKPIDFSEEEL
ncbi:hypothetical protein PCE1_001414 [Barthelona sp. PCE]